MAIAAARAQAMIGTRSRCANEEAGAAFSAVDEKDPDLYASIEEMREANQGAEFPVHDRAAQKLLRRVQA